MTPLLLVSVWFFGLEPQFIPLAATPTKLDVFQHDQLILVEDGSIMALSGDYKAVYHWEASGALKMTIRTGTGEGDPSEIATCLYDTRREIYWISDTASQHCYFYDKQGRLLGKGSDQEGNDKFRMRQLISTKGRTFAVDTARVDIWRNPDAPLIGEVSFRIADDGKITITRKGDPFCRITKEQRSMDYNFKQVWVVQDPYHQNLYVVDQLSPRIRHFVPNPRDENDRVEAVDRQISFGLPRYVLPPQTWNPDISNKEELKKWWFSWSRINGFYHIEGGFVVSYDIPDKKRKNQCLLGLQKIKRNGKRMGQGIVLDGWMIGVRENRAYILLGPMQGRGAWTVAIHDL